jgi:CubicO group peptidase (beta-lactamase class C family)
MNMNQTSHLRICVGILVFAGLLSAVAGRAPAQEKKVSVTGLADADLAPFDDLMINFVRDNQVPGAALAVAKDGKLVYARGFGHADEGLAMPVQPGVRFRIASVSKPITAALMMRLIELGLLTLGDNPFAILRIALPAESDPRLRKITIRQLLQHTGGWDRDVSFDPMFRPIDIAREQMVKAPAKALDIIHFMAHHKLDFDPGARYAYSNFGYCILGRVAEKVTGLSYEAAVQQYVFNPIGVKHSQLGHTLTASKNEVHYFDEKKRTANAVVGPNFGKPVPLPYGAWYLEAMDSHGGWISSAPDLVRFASSLDHPEKCKILKADSIRTMFARPDGPAGQGKGGKPKDVFYGCGWQVRVVGEGRINTWHNGALDGTSTLLVRRSDGLTWAVLFNTRNNQKGMNLSDMVDGLVHQAADMVKRWPDRNLFEKGL